MDDVVVGRIVFSTPRLDVHLATIADAPLIHDLWTDHRVMRNVGFPKGLPISIDQIREDIYRRNNDPFQQLLIVRMKESGEAIGQCKMEKPNDDGVAETDVKLKPIFWGQRFGIELKRGLLNFIFTHTDCIKVQATPNISNMASIKMQESVGGVKVGESVYEFPESMAEYTVPVKHYIYEVTREAWTAQKRTEPLKQEN